MSVICTKGNKAMTNSGCTNIYFTLNGPQKMAPPHLIRMRDIYESVKRNSDVNGP